ncbi:MAG: FG-GAP-like repeat-containing protein, partial [Flavobacteriales bacterium]
MTSHFLSQLKGRIALNQEHNSLIISTTTACLTVMLAAALLMVACTPLAAQTTWTEQAGAYGLNLTGAKDGGLAFCDYDLDGDFDLLINRNNRSFLYRNNGNGSFTDVTAALAPALMNNGLERTAIWGDLNNDGYPDFARNSSARIEVYLQHPASGVFGNGTGGTAPQVYAGNGAGNFLIQNGMNSEGMGFLDYNGDGYLDLVFDNHNFGIDMLQNLGNGFFQQVTVMPAGYQNNDPSTWPIGLAQNATDGDYSSTTDYDNDGWVDYIARKRNQADFFRNVGGTFAEGQDVAQASNGNKGGVSFADFDNDGDFDLFWTEEGLNQIFENVNGTFVPRGAATGIPTGFGGNRPDGLVCGDIDNDGDIDIFLAGRQSGLLFINQLNDPVLGPNTGAPMTFVQAAETFYNGQGRGCAMVDIDNDGDLDIYVNINNNQNRLFINQLSGAATDNYLFVDIRENRAVANMPAGVQRDALGATLRLVDCDGTVISGIREINGGNGRGTQDVARIHFGLPQGFADTYILRADYPNIQGQPRYQINEPIVPADYPYHLYEIVPFNQNNAAPVGQPDHILYQENTAITFDVLADNGFGVDVDPDGDALFISPVLVSSPQNGTAVLNANGTFTYTPNAGFTGIDTFTYLLSDNGTCFAAGLVDEVTVTLIYSGSPDNCLVGFNPFTWTELPPNDDGSVGPINLPFEFDLYGDTYTSVFLNNNGNVSFDNPYAWYTSAGFPITTPMVAPFWADVDTRDWGPNGYQGEVWYTVTPTAFIVTWMNVGPFNAFSPAMDGLESSFTLVMTDGTDPLLAPGNNVGFFYGDMGWTTGQASGGANGFGGAPATVGINAGNGVDYILLGLFNEDSESYDGPGNNNDGVNWLDDQCFEFNVASATNFPPVAQNFPQGNAVNVCLGATETISVGFTGPETNQNVTITVDGGGWSGLNVVSNTAGNPAQLTLDLNGSALGTYTVTISGTDNHSSPETTIRTITVNVVDCNCSAAPDADCVPTVTASATGADCETFVAVPMPELSLDCLSETALNFTAPNGFVALADPFGATDFTVEFWFKPSGAVWSGVLYDMSENVPANGDNQKYFFIDGNQNQLRFWFESANDADVQATANHDLSQDRWYHVAAVGSFNSAGGHRLYIDGVQVALSNTTTNSKPTTFNTPRIGRATAPYGSNQAAFGGLMDNFRVYNIRLTPAQIDQVMCGNLQNVLGDLRLAYDFEEGVGTLAHDLSVFGNDGTLTTMGGSAWVASDLVTECTTIVNDYTGTADASANYPVGSTTVNWTFTSASGNSSSCSQVVTVTDNSAPNAVCQDITVALDANGEATITASDIDGGSSDNCGITSMSIDTNNFDCSDLSAPLVVSSSNGYDVEIAMEILSINPSSMSCAWGYNYTVTVGYDITINGAGAPASLWTLQGTVGCGSSNHFFNLPNGGGSGTVNTANAWSSLNNCATVTPEDLGCLSITLQISGPGIPNSFVNVPLGAVGQPVVLTAEDAAGNTSSCTANVTVVDNLAPVMACQNVTLTLNASGQATLTTAMVDNGSTDNCGIVDLQLSQTNFNCSHLGSNTVTLTGTDASGNSASCTAIVTVVDSQVPTISCAANVTANTNPGSCFATLSLTAPVTADNCGIASVTNNAPAQFPIGTTTVTWTVVDNAGNTATCQQTVTVVDNQLPTIVCAANVTANANAGSCFATLSLTAPVTADNCGIAS